MISRPPQITDRHLRRRAVVYVRQASPEQVRGNTGSTEIQRDLAPKLEAWGWPSSMIEILEGDLGISGVRVGARHEFNRLLDRMAAGEIGLVAVVDISRLSRNILDLCHFIDRAHRHDVLLAQGDQLIDFTDPNSNARLGFLPSGFNGQLGAGPVIADRVQAEDAPEEEAPEPPPVGYVRRADGSWAKDPDPRVRDTVTVIFDKIPETASIHGTLRYLRDAAEGETSTE